MWTVGIDQADRLPFHDVREQHKGTRRNMLLKPSRHPHCNFWIVDIGDEDVGVVLQRDASIVGFHIVNTTAREMVLIDQPPTWL